MEIPDKNVGDVCVVSLSGRLDAYHANEVEQKLNSLIESAQVRLVVNFADLAYISSSGLRVLLAVLKKVRKQQGDVKLAALQPYIKEVFDIAGFTQLFNIFEAEDAAIAAFQEA
ncbi:STAS domain-containing protein [Chloroflexota bacterium]